MDHEMGTDADLLNELVSDAPVVADRRTGRDVSLSRKQIGQWTGKSIQTITDYGAGSRNIPIDFWHRILVHYFDMRIIHLLLPDDVECEFRFREVRPSQGARQFFRDALAVEKAHHEMMVPICDILADGRIDELDAERIAAYHAAYFNHRLHDMVLHSAAHLFQDGDLKFAIRDLVDLVDLFNHFGRDFGFWQTIAKRAEELQLQRPLYYALRYGKILLDLEVPEPVDSAIARAAPPRLISACIAIMSIRPMNDASGGADSRNGSWPASFSFSRLASAFQSSST